MKELLTIPPVTIWEMFAGHYVRFLSDLDICNDGSGPDHNDPSYQSQTAFYNGGKFLNADKDKMGRKRVFKLTETPRQERKLLLQSCDLAKRSRMRHC